MPALHVPCDSLAFTLRFPIRFSASASILPQQKNGYNAIRPTAASISSSETVQPCCPIAMDGFVLPW